MLQKLILFSQSPQQKEVFQPMKVKELLGLFLITLIFIAPYTVLIYALGLNELDNEVMDLLRESPVVFLLIAVFIAPILEEPVYRLHLDLKKNQSIGVLGYHYYLSMNFGIHWQPYGST